MRSSLGEIASRRSWAQLAVLLKVQARLSVREPYGLGLGLGLPVVLLVVFGVISKQVPGNVAGSGLTVIDLYIPTLMVISFIAIAITLPNTLVRDREIGWLRRLSTTPVHPSRLLAAQLILDLVLAAAAIAVLTVGGTAIFGPLGRPAARRSVSPRGVTTSGRTRSVAAWQGSGSPWGQSQDRRDC